MSMTPRFRPAWTKQKCIEVVGNKTDLTKPVILGIRGYFRDSMGAVGVNDRGIYDDAFFVIAPKDFRSFWGNTDPSRYRKGHGTDENTKGMASLVPGVWTYTRGMHRGKYMALVQKVEPVTVKRDGEPDYLDTGWHGINIHRGGLNTTSSLGCQTLHPAQWDEFYGLVSSLMVAYDMKTIEYVLVEGQG